MRFIRRLMEIKEAQYLDMKDRTPNVQRTETNRLLREILKELKGGVKRWKK